MEMQLLDADYFLNGNKPVVRLFGRTQAGNAVCALVSNYRPYFYTDASAEELRNAAKATSVEIVSAEEQMLFTPEGYQKEKQSLRKVTLTSPPDVPKLREYLYKQGRRCYEADILFKYRFMIDHGLRGMEWVRFDGSRANSSRAKCACYEAQNLAPDGVKENAKLRYMAFDIECLPGGDRTPTADKDPIIMIAFSFMPAFAGKNTLVIMAKPFSGNGTKGFSGEKEMLEEFLRIVDSYDPDIITGYNINTFDLPYILERLRKNGLSLNFGRADKPVTPANMSQSFIVPGRVAVDPYQILKRDPWVKFVRYDLNTVAQALLGEKKLDVEYKDMASLWNGGREDVEKFAEYARKDAELSLRLVLEKRMLDKFFELAKISGLLLQDIFGGQTRRIEVMLLHEFKKRSYVMPDAPSKRELTRRNIEREKKGLVGATVLEPKRGLHADGCVLVLDFKSLYPSLMRTYNISPDTLLLGMNATDGTGCYESPSGAKFIDAGICRGIFPDILTQLVEMRASIKKAMRSASGEERRMLNAKQLAIKDVSNSFYGYTGYVRARLYMIDVASSITAYGRKNLIKTKDFIEQNFPVEVIYSDTDSAFVKTGIQNLGDAKALGEKIAAAVTETLPGELELQFEKVYRTFLILTKKRYAGWKFDYVGDAWHDEIEMKGIETVRRDWCPLVSEVMNAVLETILKEGDLKKAIEILQNVIEKLRKNEIPLEKLTIVKGITKSLASYAGMLPHIEAARKMASRNASAAPKVGDRLGFVIIRGNQMLSKRAEDPRYAAANNLAVDSDYYIYNQIFPPIERIFAALGVEKGEIFGGGRQTTLLGTGRRTKSDIRVEFSNGAYNAQPDSNSVNAHAPQASEPMAGWEEFVCNACRRPYRRMPLSGVCECGGRLLIAYHGSVGNKIVMK